MVVHYNLREQVLNAIGSRIISGELSPGDVLPKEDTLSEQYGVSRTVIREAVKGLAARGLVESRPKVGTIIRPRSDWQMLDPSVLEWVASSTPDSEFMYDLAEVRLVIEPDVAALAARNATDEEIERITSAYEALEAVAENDEEAWARADLEFHASIVAACNNEFLAYIVSAIRKPLYSRRLINVSLASIMKPEDVAKPYKTPREEVLARHRALLEAIQQHDEKAAKRASCLLMKRVTHFIMGTEFDESCD
jgi:DNA-binding FadR family transcriptional regulator